MIVYIGIDWSENKHDVCFLDETGEVLLVKQIPHTIAGFRQLDQAGQSLAVGRQEVIIGLETAHNFLVDYLWDQGYEQIYALPPSAVKSAQKRYRQSGAKDDRWDAHLIANLLRTDQPCYTPWQPDQPLTRQIRAEVRFAQQRGPRPALVLPPAAYNGKACLAILCPITSQIKGYPFEVVIPDGLDVSGAILSDHVKSLDWKARKAEFGCKLPSTTFNEVVQKLSVLIVKYFKAYKFEKVNTPNKVCTGRWGVCGIFKHFSGFEFF